MQQTRQSVTSSSHELDITNAPFEAQQLRDWLANGKPELGWRGDPRLELYIGVITAANFGRDRNTGNYYRKGDVVAHRYEVWRHNEDGTDTPILQRPSNLWHEIIPALISNDPRTPGFVPVMDRVEKENAVVEKANSDEHQGWMREATEHLWRLAGEREHGRNTTYQMPGRNPDKQL